MDYKKAYEETISKLMVLRDDWASTQNRAAKEVESAFPELKESEDERIRKGLIGFLQDEIDSINRLVSGDYDERDADDIAHQKWCEKALAWLEKQREKKPVDIKPHKGDSNNPYDMSSAEADEYTIDRGFDIPWNDGDVFVDERYITQTVGNVLRWADNNPRQKPADSVDEGKCLLEFFESQKDFYKKIGDQKRVERIQGFIDMLTRCELIKDSAQLQQESSNEQISDEDCEAKFKIGDWIVDTNGKAKEIIDIKEGFYYLEDEDGRYHYDIKYINANFRLWTINDAKDGDILAYKDGWTCIFKSIEDDIYVSSYCFMDFNEDFYFYGGKHPVEIKNVGKIFPATEVRREIFFSSMRKSGYAWDPDKKELIKIDEHKECSSNACDNSVPAEMSDEDEINVSRLIEGFSCSSWADDIDEGWKAEILSWLKSLKPRIQSQWKPSDEQMNALKNAAKHFGGCDPDDWDVTLESLFNDLKKLRGE